MLRHIVYIISNYFKVLKLEAIRGGRDAGWSKYDYVSCLTSLSSFSAFFPWGIHLRPMKGATSNITRGITERCTVYILLVLHRCRFEILSASQGISCQGYVRLTDYLLERKRGRKRGGRDNNNEIHLNRILNNLKTKQVVYFAPTMSIFV